MQLQGKDINFGSTNEIGFCYTQAVLDIGTYEFGSLAQASN